MSNEKTYLGDGVYARYNGQEIVLCTEDHEIWLDTGMLKQLQRLVDNYEPPEPTEDYRGGERAGAAAHEQGRIQRELKR